jgi:NTE family protein
MVGCAQLPSNEHLARPPDAAADYDFKNWIGAHEKLDDLVVLSFSGGGLRAATLASSVLEQLDALGYSKKIALISSASGGSVVAGYFAMAGPEGLKAFREDFLYKDNTSDLTFRLLPSLLSGANRSEQFANYLDERLFQSKHPRYGDLVKRWKDGTPFVILNASDASLDWTFEFTQNSFSQLCSDLSSFRVSLAISASAAFPFLMSPITLKNYWDNPECRDRIRPYLQSTYDEALRRRYVDLASFVLARYARSLRYTYETDPGLAPYRRIEFVHLIDGGLADNLAARPVLRAFDINTMRALQQKGVKRILLVQVNAKSEEERQMDHSAAIPSWIEVFKTVALNPVDVTTALSSYVSKEYWGSLLDSIQARSGSVGGQTNEALHFYFAQVDFDLMETTTAAGREKQRRVKAIATNWTLSKEDVMEVEAAGRALLPADPCFLAFVSDMKTGANESVSVTNGCDNIVVVDRQLAQLVPPPPPPPPPSKQRMLQRLRFESDESFDTGKATLKQGAISGLDDLLAKLKNASVLNSVTITGHTDSTGTAADNEALSLSRAQAVRNYLVDHGIPADKTHVTGMGESQPIADNKTNEGRAKNRRVDVEVDCYSVVPQ